MMTTKFRPIFALAIAITLCLQIAGMAQENERRGDRRDRRDREDRGRNGRRFDAAEYMKRLDRNRNGVLETSEMVGRTSSYLKDLGFNPEKPIAISKIADKINGKSDDDNKSKRGDVVIKVPGFGVEREKTSVSGFTPSTGNSKEALERKYGEETMEQVERTMQRYDRNRDGSLNTEEIKNARWGRPTPQESDLNRDGSLSKEELAHRYSAREREERRTSRETQSRESRGRERNESSRDSNRSRVVSSRTSSRPRVTTSTPRTPVKTSSPSSNTGSDRYRRYAQGLIKQYDKNGDGQIDKEELSNMRRAPKGADVNNDGFVTEQELADVLSGKTTTQASTATATAKLEQERSSENNRRSSRFRSGSSSSSSSSRSRSRTSVSFSGNDTNGDGQLQMSEYSDEWDGDLLAEFDRIDRNRDGVITAQEWAKKDK